VQAFQRVRGLPTTGELDELTWSTLLEAGWRLGSRLLFLSRPYLRGDDVAQLQESLAQLGFDPVRVDGIFGPQTESALADFQRNVGLSSDGTLTLATLTQLQQLSGLSSGRRLVSDARSANGLDAQAYTQTLIVHGTDAVATALLGPVPLGAMVIHESDPSDAAAVATANQYRASLVLSTRPRRDAVGFRIYYWQSDRSYSVTGQRLAQSLATSLDEIDGVQPVIVTGLSLPLLRETMMTTLILEYGDLSSELVADVTRVLRAQIRDVFHRETTS